MHRIAEGVRGQVFRRRPDYIPGRAGGQKIVGDRVAVRARMRLHGAFRCQPTAVHETSGGHVDVGCKCYCVPCAFLTLLHYFRNDLPRSETHPLTYHFRSAYSYTACHSVFGEQVLIAIIIDTTVFNRFTLIH